MTDLRVVAEKMIVHDRVIGYLQDEIERQDALHPDGYPATRTGIRLAIATAHDEVDEAFDEWRAARCKCPVPRCNHADWVATQYELLQAAAVIMRAVRSIEDATIVVSGAGGQSHEAVEAERLQDQQEPGSAALPTTHLHRGRGASVWVCGDPR